MIIYLNILNNRNKSGTVATANASTSISCFQKERTDLSGLLKMEAFLAKEAPRHLLESSDFRCPSCQVVGVHSASVTSRPPAPQLRVCLAEDSVASPWPPPSRRPSLLWPCARCADVCSETVRMWSIGHSGGTGECFHRFCAAVCAVGTAHCRPWRSHTSNSETELWDASPRALRGSGTGPAPPEGRQEVFQIHVPEKVRCY